MKEKLIIKNFGPIKAVDLEIRRFNVIIGDNGTGKSTIAKVMTLCRDFLVIAPYESETTISDLKNGFEKYGLSECIENESVIFYECEDYHLNIKYRLVPEKTIDVFGNIITNNKTKFHPEFTYQSDRFRKIVSTYQTVLEVSHDNPESLSIFFRELRGILDIPIYMPAERVLQSVFSLGRRGIDNLSDSLYQFFREFDRYSKFYSGEFYKIEHLDIEYINEDGKGSIKTKNGKVVGLKDSASGFQSSIPIVLGIDYYIKQNEYNKFYVIEEPEINLFPKTQAQFMKYLVDRTMNCSNKMLITTHSPYTLTSLNNMMYAYELGQEHGEEVENVMDKKYWLNPAEVSAYMMKEDGTCEDIMDYDESGTLIKAEKIDDISDTLNKQFDELINIELTSQ